VHSCVKRHADTIESVNYNPLQDKLIILVNYVRVVKERINLMMRTANEMRLGIQKG